MTSTAKSKSDSSSLEEYVTKLKEGINKGTSGLKEIKQIIETPDLDHKLLINRCDENINKAYDKKGQSILHYAAAYGQSYGYLNVLQFLLLSRNINANKGNKYGETPLMTAIRYNQPQTAIALINHPSIDVNKRANNSAFYSGHTALYFASSEEEIPSIIVRALLCHPQINSDVIEDALDYATSESTMLMKKYAIFQQLFRTILKTEQEQNLFKLSQEIDKKLRNGEHLNINETTEQNENILHALCEFQCNIDLLKGLSFKIDITSKTKSGETALEIAKKCENKEAVMVLISKPLIIGFLQSLKEAKRVIPPDDILRLLISYFV